MVSYAICVRVGLKTGPFWRPTKSQYTRSPTLVINVQEQLLKAAHLSSDTEKQFTVFIAENALISSKIWTPISATSIQFIISDANSAKVLLSTPPPLSRSTWTQHTAIHVPTAARPSKLRANFTNMSSPSTPSNAKVAQDCSQIPKHSQNMRNLLTAHLLSAMFPTQAVKGIHQVWDSIHMKVPSA
jgi:hypothetical protein